jgi:hypothetical protein
LKSNKQASQTSSRQSKAAKCSKCSQQRFALGENLVAHLLGGLSLDSAAAQIELFAVAAFQ